jgi:hypothetical protein
MSCNHLKFASPKVQLLQPELEMAAKEKRKKRDC